MPDDPRFSRSLVSVGVAAGIAAGVMYPARTFLPLPDTLAVACFIYFGPFVTVGIVGLYPFLAKVRTSVPLALGTLFGAIAGVTNMTFAVVQLENLHYIRGYARAAATPEGREAWGNILNGVFTVQNGLNYVSDFFLDWCIFLLAWSMWTHPKFGKAFAIAGVVAAGAHFGMKAWTFPVPPSEAGLFDAGPAVSVWFALVTLQVLRHLRWMNPPAQEPVIPPGSSA
jgi:hypothetical protein